MLITSSSFSREKSNYINKLITKEYKLIDAQSYKNEPKDHNFKALYHLMKRKEEETTTNSKDVHIKILGSGKLFGVEDFMSKNNERKYSYSVICKSLNSKIMIFNKDTALQKLKLNENTWSLLKQNRVNKLEIIKTQKQANEVIDQVNSNMAKVEKGKQKTIMQQMKDNVFVRNGICDARDGLKDLIIAKYGTPKRIK